MTRKIVSLLLCLVFAFAFAAVAEETDLWASALYTEDTELGEGANTILLTVEIPEHIVKFTVHTDLTVVGEALQELGIIDGEEGPFGLYLKVANGITADYDVDQSYWGFFIDGEYAMTGIDATEYTEGAEYSLVYTK